MSDTSEKKLKVIVVDNEKKICDLIKFFLTLSPYVESVVVAENALQASQKMQNQKFDLLIADHLMPGKTGIEMAEQLRKNPRFNRMKIMIISGCLSKENIMQLISVGVKDVLVKPFKREQLLEKINEMFKLD